MKSSFRDLKTGDFYTIEFVWLVTRKQGWFRPAVGHYEMFVLTRPECAYPTDLTAHLHEGERICVREGFEPKTLDRAKAIALHWLRGFSIYARTGTFPNGAAKVNVS